MTSIVLLAAPGSAGGSGQPRHGGASGRAARGRDLRRDGRRSRGPGDRARGARLPEPQRARGRRRRRREHPPRARPARRPVLRQPHAAARACPAGTSRRCSSSSPGAASRPASMDGGFGSHVAPRVRRFQAWAGLAADGVAGPGTLAALRRPIPRSPIWLVAPDRDPRRRRLRPARERLPPRPRLPGPGRHAGDRRRPRLRRLRRLGLGGYGNLVVIEHPQGVRLGTRTCRGSTSRPGDVVVAGARVGARRRDRLRDRPAPALRAPPPRRRGGPAHRPAVAGRSSSAQPTRTRVGVSSARESAPRSTMCSWTSSPIAPTAARNWTSG